MVIDHHQFNVFRLILYTSWHMWSLRRNNTVFQFYHKNRHTFLFFSDRNLFSFKDSFRKAHTVNTKINSCVLHHTEKKGNDKSKRVIFVKLNQVFLFLKFQIKMRAALRIERQRKDNISRRRRVEERWVKSCFEGGEWRNCPLFSFVN